MTGEDETEEAMNVFLRAADGTSAGMFGGELGEGGRTNFMASSSMPANNYENAIVTEDLNDISSFTPLNRTATPL